MPSDYIAAATLICFNEEGRLLSFIEFPASTAIKEATRESWFAGNEEHPFSFWLMDPANTQRTGRLYAYLRG
jgi:hypothetical protein